MKVLEFLRDNYQTLVVIVLSLGNIAICLFRKKVKVVDDIREFILDNLPFYIVSAEQLHLGGKDKKYCVVEAIKKLLTSKYGIDADVYVPFIDDSIEKILSTPEKKEVR